MRSEARGFYFVGGRRQVKSTSGGWQRRSRPSRRLSRTWVYAHSSFTTGLIGALAQAEPASSCTGREVRNIGGSQDSRRTRFRRSSRGDGSRGITYWRLGLDPVPEGAGQRPRWSLGSRPSSAFHSEARALEGGRAFSSIGSLTSRKKNVLGHSESAFERLGRQRSMTLSLGDGPLRCTTRGSAEIELTVCSRRRTDPSADWPRRKRRGSSRA